MSMKFEYDPAKSAANKAKHGLDFIGCIGGKIWTGVITYRGNAVRIISVRRARKDEVEHYGS